MVALPRDACKSKRGGPADALDFGLTPVQTGMCGCPWRVVVASALLNRTHVRQVRPALRELLRQWPDPESLSVADPWDVSSVVHGCGFAERRSKALVTFSTGWLADSWRDLRELYGVGPYVADAVGLFCFGCTDLVSTDRVLAAYAERIRKNDCTS